MAVERTFLMVKPDGVQRGLMGEVLTRFEKRGLKLAAVKMMQIDQNLAAEHYKEHLGKGFFNRLISYITSGPVLAMVVEGDDAVMQVRAMLGATDPNKADRGTVRGDYCVDVSRNLCHGSDSLESAEREIGLFFKKEEILDYRRSLDQWFKEA